jgi:hypothetical protein
MTNTDSDYNRSCIIWNNIFVLKKKNDSISRWFQLYNISIGNMNKFEFQVKVGNTRGFSELVGISQNERQGLVTNCRQRISI